MAICQPGTNLAQISWHVLRLRENPGKNLNQEIDPTGHRTRARCVRSNDVTYKPQLWSLVSQQHSAQLRVGKFQDRVIRFYMARLDWKLQAYMQSGREISTIIVTDGYLCYKEPKSPYNVFLIFIFTELFNLKLRTPDNIEWRVALLSNGRISTSCLWSHTDPFGFSTVLGLPWLSDQKISMFCYMILRKIHHTSKILLKTDPSLLDKPTDIFSHYL